MMALGLSLNISISYLMYAVTFWYGAKLVREEGSFTAGDWLVVSTPGPFQVFVNTGLLDLLFQKSSESRLQLFRVLTVTITR